MFVPQRHMWALLIAAALLGACTSPYASTTSPSATPAAVTASPQATATLQTVPTSQSSPTLEPNATPEAPTDTPVVPTETPQDGAAYPYPLPATPEATDAPTAYPEAAANASGKAITIETFEPDGEQVHVAGTTTLDGSVCIQTWLYADGKLVSWWPTEQCASIRDGRWTLSFTRSALSEQDTPGAEYTLIAKVPDDFEAGEARLILQTYIPYHGRGN